MGLSAGRFLIEMALRSLFSARALCVLVLVMLCSLHIGIARSKIALTAICEHCMVKC